MRSVLASAPANLGRRLKERRLTRRIETLWREKARENAAGGLPSWREFEACVANEDLSFCFAVDMRISDSRPYFIFIGDALWRFSGVYLAGKTQWETALIDIAAAKMNEAALNKSAVPYLGHLRLDGGGRMTFRSVILPLADNGVDVTHVFGAASGRAS